MAANKFATMLHRKTNKLTLILVYAFLEWILIVLLLLNSLFSYLILKFADYFGLSRPCIWCSRIDHVFEPARKSQKSYRDLVCDDHASEIGKLGYCSNHRKLAESQHMCEDCSSSTRPSCGELPNIAFLPWMKHIGEVGSVSKCSCCGVSVDASKLFSPCVLIKPSLGMFDDTHEGVLIAEAGVNDGVNRNKSADDQAEEEQRIGKSRGIEVDFDVDGDDSAIAEKEDVGDIGSGSEVDVVVGKEQDLIKLDDDDDLSFSMDELSSIHATTQVDSTIDASPEILSQHLDFFIGHDDYRLIPVDLIDSATEENQIQYTCEEVNQDVVLNFDVDMDVPVEREAELLVEKIPLLPPIHEKSEDEAQHAGAESMELGELVENARSLVPEDEVDVEEDKLIITAQSTEIPSVNGDGVQKTVREMDEAQLAGVESRDLVELVENAKSLVPEEEVDVEVDELIITAQTTEIPSVNGDDFQRSVREIDEAQLAGVESRELGELVENDRSLVPEEEKDVEVDEFIITAQATEIPSANGDDVEKTVREMEADAHLASEEEDTEMQDDEIEADVSIGTEIPDHEHIDEYQAHEDPSYQTVQENTSPSHDAMLATDYDHGSKKVEQEVEFKTLSVETNAHPLFSQLSRSLELNDIEEDKVPDTPSSVDSLHQFNRKWLSLERRESGTESLDGSVISDIEAGELSIEKLSSALRNERKALNALYAELEEERSASAVAANQTMAMINRLHEEKAAMQMEALQYQRMMEEQSEYDQEALQLLNELMMKREKEKQELEKELEAYRKKVQEYEAREKMLMLRRKEAGIRSMTSSVSCSNAEDSDGSVDLNREGKEDDSHFSHQDCDNNHNTPTDAVLYLEESLANFEEERMSILKELKVLEEKLFTMNSEEEEHFDDVITFENGHDNGNGIDLDGVNGDANGHHKEMNGKHHQGTRTISKPKRLLPLFDAIELEVEDGVLYGNEHGFDSASQHDSSDSRFELENKRPAIEEEVDHVYERLQALEADREFLKHCMSSLKKGDKGVYLLQEILQHLRDLRNVDLRARNIEEGVI